MKVDLRSKRGFAESVPVERGALFAHDLLTMNDFGSNRSFEAGDAETPTRDMDVTGVSLRGSARGSPFGRPYIFVNVKKPGFRNELTSVKVIT